MLLNLKDLIASPGETLDFSYDVDLSGLEFFGEHPLRRPAKVAGTVSNRAGLLRMRARVDAVIETYCASCGRQISVERGFDIDGLMTADPDTENDDFIIMQGECLDIAELAGETVVLNMDMRVVCDENCAGICVRCGHNLNDGPCGCPKQIDPRWEKLLDLK